MIMTCLFHGVHKHVSFYVAEQIIEGMGSNEILYAADTIRITQDDEGMNRLSKAIKDKLRAYGFN